MKLITYAENTNQLSTIAEQFHSSGLTDAEVIVSFRSIGRVTQTTKSELLEMIALNQKLKLNLVLEWDVLKQDSLFKKICNEVQDLPLHEFKAIRVQDPGALHFLKTNFSWVKIQLILENGNHNLEGLKRWQDYLGSQLDRLVLSNELSKDHLKAYAEKLSAPLEILAYGRILLFYSPRSLLKPVLNPSQFEAYQIETFGTSEESPHAGFPLVENQHGTFMFNVKDLFLLDHLNELRGLKVGAVRVDLRFDENFKNLSDVISAFNNTNENIITNLKQRNVRPFIKGFYNINKTDVLFSKLKNKRIQRQDDAYIGEVVDVERDFNMAVLIKSKHQTLSTGDWIRILTPEGKTKEFAVQEMTNTHGDAVFKAAQNDIVMLPFVRGIVGKSQVYLISKI